MNSLKKRMELAKNPSTPASALEKLSGDSNSFVRYWVARNPSAPAAVLEELSTDSDWYVRLHVARNPSTPVGALACLMGDPEFQWPLEQLLEMAERLCAR